MKLDFSQANVQAVGTAFWAMSVEVNTKTKQQLEAEENIGQTSDASKTSEASKTDEKKISPNDNEQTVLFADPVNGNLVKVNLSKANIEKLKEHFTDENNFFERKDGTLRLNGKAEAYVSGWFGDIAYKREFLKADADNDGKLSDEEYQNTRNAFNGHGELIGSRESIVSITEQITDSYVKLSDKTDSKIVNYSYGKQRPDSLDEELNITLEADSDFNSKMSLLESYKTNKSNKYKNLQEIVLQHVRSAFPNDQQVQNAIKNTFGNIDDASDTMQTDADLELLALQMRALQKLRAANGNESVLTAEEKEALGAELKAIKKQLESKDDLSSVKEELRTKIENTRFIDVGG
jgi:hypothetical protein